MNVIIVAKRLVVPAILGLVITAHVPAHTSSTPHTTGSGLTTISADGLRLDVSAPLVKQTMGYWVHYHNPMTGISVYLDSADWSNVVISFGKDRAKELTKMRSAARLRNCQMAAQAFGNYLMAFNHLYHGQLPFANVRNGRNVGLWVHVSVPGSILTPRQFVVRSIKQRPVGSTTPPSYMLN